MADHAKNRKLGESLIRIAAEELYASMDENEITVLRFGMLPAGKTEAKVAEVKEMLAGLELSEYFSDRSVSRLIAVGAMDATNSAGKGMVV